MKSSFPALSCRRVVTVLAIASSVAFAAPKKEEVIDPNAPVSFYKQIRPIFQAQCQGCHQPAKAKGDYIMTDFSAMLKGGEEGVAVEAGKPEVSNLPKLITPVNGKAEMPQKADPLHDTGRADQAVDRGRREGRYARFGKARVQHGETARARDCAADHEHGLLRRTAR